MPRKVANRIDRLDEFPPYRGGRTCVVGGYVFEFSPDHPLANGWGWVALHRLVAEDIVGRPLRRSKNPNVAECVHHKDECRTNNDPANLEVMTLTAHRVMHAKEHAHRLLAKITESQVRKALHGRTIKEAAALLHVHTQTLRNRFAALIAPRKRASPHRIDSKETAALIRPYASSDQYSLDDAFRTLRIAPDTIVRACRYHGIPWVHKRRPGRPPKTTHLHTARNG